ncbi:hypothetical protein GQ600_17998 [Phytophthora cactorum]|nr:hypothetical protein GQ600_17998 [Phytophthora cactorum]
MPSCRPAFQGIYIYTACEEVMQIQVAVKVGLKTPQRDWIAISESNWQTNLDAVQANHQRRTKSGPIVVELVAFVANEQSGIRRVEEASRAIDSPLREHPDIHVGEIDRTHWAITQARQLAGSTIEVPDNATFHQAQPSTQCELLNCSSRVILMLYAYAESQGVFSDFQPPADPSEDTEDTDHQ